MIYLTNSLELTTDVNATYQVHIPRVSHSIPAFYVNKGNKLASATESIKVRKALKELNLI